MREVYGNLWDFEGIHAITTNGFIKRNGEAVMGRGCALEASKRHPTLPRELGERLRSHGNLCFYFSKYNIFTFPVKRYWYEKASLSLIRSSALQLNEWILDKENTIYLPRPGCGNGGLSWDEVKPLIEGIFTTDKIVVVTFGDK